MRLKTASGAKRSMPATSSTPTPIGSNGSSRKWATESRSTRKSRPGRWSATRGRRSKSRPVSTACGRWSPTCSRWSRRCRAPVRRPAPRTAATARDSRRPRRRRKSSMPSSPVSEEARLDDDRYLRALADLENYRKRSAQEVERRVSEQAERLLLDWIEAVDSVDRALGMQPSDGLRGVLEQMEAILARQGVERVGAAGDRFDPELHEAISVQESDEVPDRTVLDVARSGYRRGERVLRPAQVVVSRNGGSAEREQGPSGEGED